MRPSNLVAGAVLLIALSGVPVLAATPPEELAALRQAAIAAARDTQQKERVVAATEDEIRLLASDADARQRGLDETRAEQARLLGTIERVARHPPERRAVFAEAPVDELRSERLRQAAMPALRTQARALSNEIARIAALRQQIAAKQGEIDAARQALAGDRERLAGLVLRRFDLTRLILPEDAGAAARIERLARDAADLGELIKSATAAADRHDKDLLARIRSAQRRTRGEAAEHSDPTRPNGLRTFDPPQSALIMPVSGAMIGRFGDADAAGGGGDGVILSALAGAAVVAPFDGRLVYAGPFRDFALILIFRHGNSYNSMVAGLGRVDIKLDQWVLAGEPVGAVPDAPPPDASPPAGEDRTGVSGRRLYFEFHREGRPLDPQPWLANGDDGRDRRNGDQRVFQ